MSNNRKPGTGPAAKAPHRKINLLPFLASAAVVICITVVFFVSRNGTSNANGTAWAPKNGILFSTALSL